MKDLVNMLWIRKMNEMKEGDGGIRRDQPQW